MKKKIDYKLKYVQEILEIAIYFQMKHRTIIFPH